MTRRASDSIDAETPDCAPRLAATPTRLRRRARYATALLIALAGGYFSMHAASAYFRSTGSGTGHASNGTFQSPIVAATGTVTSPLRPGDTADLHLVIVNPNSYAVTIAGITQTPMSSISVTGAIGTCTSASAGVGVSASQPLLPLTITAINGGSQTVDVAGGASMTASSATGCQHASFTIPVTLTVRAP